MSDDRRQSDRDLMEIKSSLSLILNDMQDIKLNQVGFKGDIEHLRQAVERTQETVIPIRNEMNRIDERLKNLEEDTDKQWNHITGLKDGQRESAIEIAKLAKDVKELSKTNNEVLVQFSSDHNKAEFWDSDTKKGLLWLAGLILMGLFALAGVNVLDLKGL
jgi:predicted nuclease with TOPRIM domain